MAKTPIAAYFQNPVSNLIVTGKYGVTGGLKDNPKTSIDESKLYHLGVDLGGTTNTSITATAHGRVVDVGFSHKGFGKYVILEHNLTDGTKIYSLYAHLSTISVSKDQVVLMGDTLGKMGGSGGTNPNMYPVHLHFELSTKNLFTQDGQFGGGYDDATQFSETRKFTVDPIAYINSKPITGVQNGTSGSDLIVGVKSNERLDGRSGDDEINGNGGNDTITGGLGKDVMFGGQGADYFDFNSTSESRVGITSRDSVMDFERGVDKIDLSTIDASTRFSGDQSFVFIGTAAFRGLAGDLRMSGGVISGDINGDKIADFEISVRGMNQSINSLSASDFFL